MKLFDFLGAAAALVMSFGLVTSDAEAATIVITPGGDYDVGYGDDFLGFVYAGTTGAGSVSYTFEAAKSPIEATVEATINNGLAAVFKGLTVSWLSEAGDILSSTAVVPSTTSLSTIFSGDNLKQTLVFSWTNVSQSNIGFDFEVVAPVPLPAGGLLLIGAMGGLAALSRRRKAA